MAEILIGIDGGGTNTRAIAIDRTGRRLGFALSGGCNPQHAPDAEHNVQEAIRLAVSSACAIPSDVVGLVAGLAGLDDPEDYVRGERQTALEGLDCPRLQVNDAVVAHTGALQSQPGIIAISGTGSIVFGINEAGQHLRNYDFRHYAPSAAGHLSRDAMHRLLAGDAQPIDKNFMAQVLAFWEADDLPTLRERAFGHYSDGEAARNYRLGEMGKLVTDAAQSGAPVAQACCQQAAAMMGIGIRLVGTRFISETIQVVLVGGAVRSDYMQAEVAHALARDPARRFEIVEPAFSPVIGAALMALERHGIEIDTEVLANLRAADTQC